MHINFVLRIRFSIIYVTMIRKFLMMGCAPTKRKGFEPVSKYSLADSAVAHIKRLDKERLDASPGDCCTMSPKMQPDVTDDDDDSSSQTSDTVRNSLRRLSTCDSGLEVSDESIAPRGLVRSLAMQSLLDLCALGRCRGWSVDSQTDGDMHRRQSYGDKCTVVRGSRDDTDRSSFGYACKKGLKPISPNQDSFLILNVEDRLSMFGVFDGHGRFGHDVSDFVKDILPKFVVRDPEFRAGNISAALTNAFRHVQECIVEMTDDQTLDASASGTTATLVVCMDGKVHVAHVGDSRCVVGYDSKSSGAPWAAQDASIDHKPDLPAERTRIQENGGMVLKPPMDVNHRVYVRGTRFPGLAMSRALGDVIGYREAGISATPDVRVFDATQGSDKSLDVLLLCSDGVWEFISSQEALNIAAASRTPATNEVNCMKAAEDICKQSWNQWFHHEHGVVVDDITAIVVHLPALRSRGALSRARSRSERSSSTAASENMASNKALHNQTGDDLSDECLGSFTPSRGGSFA